MDDFCGDHAKHDFQLKNHEDRIGNLEEDSDEIKQVITRIDTLVASLNKMYWIVVVAVVGCIVASFWALIAR